MSPHNLPAQRTSFVGRMADLAAVEAALAETAPVTLIGAGGCGKTRLALQMGAQVLDRYPDGVWLAELAPIADPDAVPAQVSTVFALNQSPGTTPTDALAAYLGDKQALVLLDNCEHVIDAAARLATTLLSRCRSVRILATSRQPLGVAGEVAWRVPSLSLPAEDATPTIESVTQAEAVQLFVDRARRARPGFTITEWNADAVAQICRRLDGIPLAIELAAARVGAFAPAQIVGLLSERFRLLAGGIRTAPPRQQTLEASIDWSHDLLTQPEQVVFRRLSVFAGSFSFEAAEDVCSGGLIERNQVLDLLLLLIDKSLVHAEYEGERTRYHLLETIRYYAADRLARAGEGGDIRSRHRDHFLRFAEEAEPQLEGLGQVAWLASVATDYANLRAALAWSRDRGEITHLVRTAVALMLFWKIRGPMSEGEAWLDAGLSTMAELPGSLRAQGLMARSYLGYGSSDLAGMAALATRGLQFSREIADDRLAARCLLALAAATRFGPPTAFADEAVELARRVDDRFVLAEALRFAGAVHLFREPERARSPLEDSILVAEKEGNLFTAGTAQALLGLACYLRGEMRETKSAVEQALAGAEAIGDRWTTASALGPLGLALASGGELTEALAVARRLEVTNREAGTAFLECEVRRVRGMVAVTDGRLDEARRLGQEGVAVATFPQQRAMALVALGEAELAGQELDRSRSHAQETMAMSEATHFAWGRASGLVLQARLQRLGEEPAAAERSGHDALETALGVSAKGVIVDALEALAGIALDLESHEEAVRIFGAAQAIRDRIGYSRCVSERDHDIARLRELLDAAIFETVYEQGRELSLEEAVSYVRRGRGERKRPSAGWASISPTEQRVVALVRQGLTNAEIGKRLFISPRTVNWHLTQVYAKLSISSRAELAAEAAQRGM